MEQNSLSIGLSVGHSNVTHVEDRSGAAEIVCFINPVRIGIVVRRSRKRFLTRNEPIFAIILDSIQMLPVPMGNPIMTNNPKERHVTISMRSSPETDDDINLVVLIRHDSFF